MEERIYKKETKTQFNVKAIMFTLLLGSFISLFNETILNVAFPQLMEQMKVNANTVQWLTTGYVLVVGILVPVTAFLIHTFTTKQLYLSAMILFLLGTICAIFSSSFVALLVSRLIQALGTGMLIPIMMNSALVVTPKEKHGSVMGLCVAVISLGPALGPTVSGLMLQFFNWHSLFILLVPFLLICIAFGCMFLVNTSEITKPKIDYLSILLSSIGFAGVTYSISSVGTAKALVTVIIFVIGLISLMLWSRRQFSLSEPMLELRAFKHPIFTIGVILFVLIQMFQFSANMILPLLLQDGLNTSSFVSALSLLPAIVIAAILAPFVGKIYDKAGGRVLIPSGFLVICLFTFVLSHVTPATSVIAITLIYCFIMVGVSMAMSTSQTAALSQLPGKNQADGVAIVNTAMQLAGALGSAIYVGIMTAYQNRFLSQVSDKASSQNQVKAIFSGFRHSITVAAILIAIGFILSLILSSRCKKREKRKE
ncbi:MDR family MFS transporter [Clostridium oryzae]|uniref:Putative transport protein HsrA n=1 Tax=Clostridium oryzae TaxID=1450648 RepID=A0A1V4IMX1_9CLOT|nr:MDR family MFS transporter [Clostridium oryzae]OPJ61189.1 putative transport protein HsrA [Clostridium oryzae]